MTTRTTMGVIVARFQSPGLHAGHRTMLTQVAMKHDVLLVVLGVSRAYMPTRSNPLGIAARMGLVREWEQAIGKSRQIVLAIAHDCRSDHLWSKRLDEIVRREQSKVGCGSVTLYGSRDSFLARYHGELPRQEVPSTLHPAATFYRQEVFENANRQEWWTTERAEGAIAAVEFAEPTIFQAVDIAIVDWGRRRMLFAMKEEDQLPGQEKLRFVGGFVDRDDKSLEDAAKREAMEETGLEVGVPSYLGSFRVDDWRYREPEGSRVFTALFGAEYVSGAAKAADDISKVRWMSFADLQREPRPWLVDEHQPLLAAALDSVRKMSEDSPLDTALRAARIAYRVESAPTTYRPETGDLVVITRNGSPAGATVLGVVEPSLAPISRGSVQVAFDGDPPDDPIPHFWSFEGVTPMAPSEKGQSVRHLGEFFPDVRQLVCRDDTDPDVDRWVVNVTGVATERGFLVGPRSFEAKDLVRVKDPTS